MNAPQNNHEIFNALQAAFEALHTACQHISEKELFDQPAGKWSKAQHLQHLIISTQTSTAAFALPLFIIRLVGGKPKRPSCTFDELVSGYLKRLQEGRKASGRYIPRTIPASIGKDTLLEKWQKVSNTFLIAFEKTTPDSALDQYQVPHPILGKITLRELAFFTIYHTSHHQKAIQSR